MAANTPFAIMALRGLCPACERGSVFAGAVRFAPRCDTCGLTFDQFNVGDGPAAFLILIIGALIMIGAVWLELAVGPPVWVHILIWVPLTALLVILLLRVAKAALLTLEYRHRAREGRIVE